MHWRAPLLAALRCRETSIGVASGAARLLEPDSGSDSGSDSGRRKVNYGQKVSHL